MAKQQITLGFILLVLLTSSVYLVLDDDIRIDIQNTKSIFQVNENGEWVVAGVEYVNLFDGTAKMRAKERDIQTDIFENTTIITRTALYKNAILVVERYFFDGNIDDITLFPVKHTIEIIGADRPERPYILQYEVQKLLYTGETISNVESPQEFGHQMKVEWDDGNYYSKIYKYAGKDEGKLTIKYRIDSNKFNINVRLFDPPVGDDLIIENGETYTLGGYNDTFDVVWVKLGGTLNIDSSDKNLTLIANNITIDGVIDATGLITPGGTGAFESGFGGTNGGGGGGSRPGAGGTAAYTSSGPNYAVACGGGGAGGAVGGSTASSTSYVVSCTGGSGGGAIGTVDNNQDETVWYGSAGGGGGAGSSQSSDATGGTGGTGGGWLILEAKYITISGSLDAGGNNGGTGSSQHNTYATGAGAGGGSGGTIKLNSIFLDISGGELDVGGGVGSSCVGACTSGANRGTGGGNAAGGRIKLFSVFLENTSTTIDKGTGSYYYSDENTLDVLLESPIYEEIVSPPVNMTCRSVSNQDISMYIDGIHENTSTGVISISKTLADGAHYYTCNTSTLDPYISNFTVESSPPIVNNLTPVDNFVSDTNSNTFIINLSKYLAVNLGNVTLYTDEDTTWAARQSNSSAVGLTDAVVTMTRTFNLKDVLWSLEYCDQLENCNFTSNRTLIIDYTAPTVDITSPSNISYITNISQVQFNATDDYLNFCWSSKDGGITNSTAIDFNNGALSLNITSDILSNNVTVYCNDTRGNLGYDNVVWYMTPFEYALNSDPTNAGITGVGNAFINVELNPVLNFQNISFRGYNLTNGNITQYLSEVDESTCYQESPTVSDQSGTDGECNLYYNGSQSFVGDYLYLNYSKPANAMNATWKVKHGTLSTYNVGVPMSCFDEYTDRIALRFVGLYQTAVEYGSHGQCWNGSSWDTITSVEYSAWDTHTSGSGSSASAVDGNWNTHAYNRNDWDWVCSSTPCEVARIFEEAVIWELSVGTSKSTTLISTTDPFYWDVKLYDANNDSYTLPIRYKGIESITLLINGSASNFISELGSHVDINATSNIYNISIDINHPSYGDNYITGFLSTYLDLIINFFRKITLSDGSLSETLSYDGTENNTIYIASHQYDEVDGMQLDMYGEENNNSYPTDVTFYKSNTGIIDRIFPGRLIGNLIYLYTLNTGAENTSLFYSSPGKIGVEFFMDDGATLNQLTFDVSGFEYGVEYSDSFTDDSLLDPSLNKGMFRGGFALPMGINLLSFIYEAFPISGALTALLWQSIPNGAYYVCGGILYPDHCDDGDEWRANINNYYSSNNMVLTTVFQEDTADVNRQTDTLNSFAIVNYTRFNIWSAQEVNFTVAYTNHGDEDGSQNDCEEYSQAYIGDVQIWQSPLQNCEDNYPSNCNEYSRSLEDLTVSMSRDVGNSWTVSFDGSEETYGDDIDDGECGDYSFIYNWTNNTLTKWYQYPGSPCRYTNSVTYLDNTKQISNLEWNTATQFKFNIYNHGSYDNGDNEGCSVITSTMTIKDFQYSLYNISNSSIISDTIFTSSGNIAAATLDLTECVNCAAQETSSLFAYLSANNGDNWEGVSNGVEHSFTYPGKYLKYRYDFALGESGYSTNIPFLQDMDITTPKGFPTDITFDFGSDGIIDAVITGELNLSNNPISITIDNTANISSAFSGYSPFDHLYEVSLKVSSSTVGEIYLDNFELTYNPNPIIINDSSIYDFLVESTNHANFPIMIESSNGNITVDNIKYDYAGGNDTIEVSVHNSDYSQNLTRNITYYYSRWDYAWVPSGVEWLYFAPTRPDAKNITPYGQTANVPIMNLTNYGYGGRDATLSIYQDGSNSCINTTISLTPNKEDGVLLIEDWVELTNMSYLETQDIYLWADYDCNYTTWNIFEPQYYFRQCVEGGGCSTDII